MRILSGLLQVVFFLALLGVALLAAGVISNRLPLTEPPGLWTRLSTYLNTNVAETRADSPFPELRLRRYEAPPELLFDVARRAAQNLKWEITVLDAAKKEIQAVVTTKADPKIKFISSKRHAHRVRLPYRRRRPSRLCKHGRGGVEGRSRLAVTSTKSRGLRRPAYAP